MNLNEKTGGPPLKAEPDASAESRAASGRKPYQKPTFRFERVFETLALSCGKVNQTQSHCRFHRKVS